MITTEEEKKIDNLKVIAYILTKGHCNDLSCYGVRAGALNKYFCPFNTNNTEAMHIKCTDRFNRNRMLQKIQEWMNENNITKQDLFPHLF